MAGVVTQKDRDLHELKCRLQGIRQKGEAIQEARELTWCGSIEVAKLEAEADFLISDTEYFVEKMLNVNKL